MWLGLPERDDLARLLERDVVRPELLDEVDVRLERASVWLEDVRELGDYGNEQYERMS